MTNPPKSPEATVPYIPENAPFTEAQRAWLNGFLAGLYSQGTASAQSPEQAAEDRPAAGPVTILFGSQTGNAETLAKKTSKVLQKKGIEAAVHDMASYDQESLSNERYLLVLTSTYGDGDPPDNAQDLFDHLHSDQTPRLDGLKYAVLALGDTNYDHFCQCGKAFDERLAQLGAASLTERVDCDVDFEGPFQSWLDRLLPALTAAANEARPTANTAASTVATETSSTNVTEDEAAETPAGYTKAQPFPAPILKNQILNGEGSAKAIHHVELSLDGSGLQYDVGDAIGVWPVNDPALVEEWLTATGFCGDETVGAGDGATMTLRAALTERLDINHLSTGFLKSYAESASHAKLARLVSPGNESELASFVAERQLIDILTEYPTSLPDAQSLVNILRKLSPRLYSIASSPSAYPGEVHLTVRAVRYESRGRSRKGVCSTFLADQEAGNEASVYIQPNPSFKLPSHDRAMIMVGPGTGIAPFRAFLQERRAHGASGKNWLFFGDQHATCDFLYQNELRDYLQDGTLSALDTAFSRDNADKSYVQHRMLEKASSLFHWLEEGAAFYVCGDASRMAKDVDAALHEIVAKQGNLSEEESTAYIKKLKKEKRYLRDIY